MFSRTIIVSHQPHFFAEAQSLMNDYFRYLEEKELHGAPWHRQPLVTRKERFTLPQEQMKAAFSDMVDYLGKVRLKAQPLLEKWPALAALYQLRLDLGADASSDRFLERAFLNLSAEAASELTREDFDRACWLQVKEWAGDLEGEDAGAAGGRAPLDAPAMDLAALFDAVSRMPLPDAQRMTLLRFFQEGDAWFPRLRDTLMALEQICRAHYPLVAERFERKAQALQAAGQEAEPLKWLSRMGPDMAGFRPEDPLHLVVSLVGYNSLRVRFSLERWLPMRVQSGILFSELEALLDKRRARDDMTERQLKAIADPTRLAIVRALHTGEKYVQQLADSLGLTPATLSHHLNTLLQALLVGVRVEGRRSYYSLNREELRLLAEDLHQLAREQACVQ